MSTLDTAETIAAIASPGGPGLRGMVRVTGPRAWAVALGGFEEADPVASPTRAERRVGRLRVEGLGRALPAAVSLWPGGRSYTGQPLAEIHAPGAPPLLGAILAGCLGRGARLAEPGEFTLRAFLSGRIDLTQSEAVLGVIDATSPAQLEEALRQLAGGLASPVRALRDRLADVLAHLEANLDFAEEPDVDPPGPRGARDRSLDEAADDVRALADQAPGPRSGPSGRPRVVLVGPPNAGKSRLFNALLGLDRAIVSPVAGTTRDYLEAACEVRRPAHFDLVDTAGIEEARPGRSKPEAQAARAAQAGVADLRPRLPGLRRLSDSGPDASSRAIGPTSWSGPRPTSPRSPLRRAGSTGHQRLDRRGARRAPAGHRPGPAIEARRRRPARRNRRAMRRVPDSAPARRSRPPPRRSGSAAGTNSSPSTSARGSTTSAGWSGPSSPTTSSTGSSAASASASDRIKTIRLASIAAVPRRWNNGPAAIDATQLAQRPARRAYESAASTDVDIQGIEDEHGEGEDEEGVARDAARRSRQIVVIDQAVDAAG